jgi:hypothetical protein
LSPALPFSLEAKAASPSSRCRRALRRQPLSFHRRRRCLHRRPFLHRRRFPRRPRFRHRHHCRLHPNSHSLRRRRHLLRLHLPRLLLHRLPQHPRLRPPPRPRLRRLHPPTTACRGPAADRHPHPTVDRCPGLRGDLRRPLPARRAAGAAEAREVRRSRLRSQSSARSRLPTAAHRAGAPGAEGTRPRPKRRVKAGSPAR